MGASGQLLVLAIHLPAKHPLLPNRIESLMGHSASLDTLEANGTILAAANNLTAVA
jgi:hypothetical protein